MVLDQFSTCDIMFMSGPPELAITMCSRLPCYQQSDSSRPAPAPSSDCLLTVWASPPPASPGCGAWRRCAGLVVAGQQAWSAPPPEPPRPRLTAVPAWLLLAGHRLRLYCGGVAAASWVLRLPAPPLATEISRLCTRPPPGSPVTAAFFHLPPLVNTVQVLGQPQILFIIH